MQDLQYRNLLVPPSGRVDVVLDTDAFNEIDDQFAISYLLCCMDKLNIKGICAAPFFNSKSQSPYDGMKKSYDEIIKLLSLAGHDELKSKVFEGSGRFLESESTPVPSAAASFMAALAEQYTQDNPLYIIAIGAITNVASSLLMNPNMKEKCVIVWLGGHSVHHPHNDEFNLRQDVAAARVVFGCGVPLVQLPCNDVVDRLSTSRYELEHWLRGKNQLCDYLVDITISEAESYASGKAWSRVIWDISAIAWLLNDHGRFMDTVLIHSPIPEYDHRYAQDYRRHLIQYVYRVNRDEVFTDLFSKLASMPPPTTSK